MKPILWLRKTESSFWDIPARSRLSIATRPELGLTSPAARLSSVVLPEPERPVMTTNSPCSMLKLMSRTAVMERFLSALYTFDTSCSVIIVYSLMPIAGSWRLAR